MTANENVNPLTTWTCHKCGEKTVTVENGYVTWNQRAGAESGFKIIHKAVCDDDRDPSSAPLSDFVGPDGIATLTGFLSPGAFMVATYGADRLTNAGFRIADLHEFTDFFRRVQLPFYEEARSMLRAPSEELRELLSDSGEVSPYLPRNLERLAKKPI